MANIKGTTKADIVEDVQKNASLSKGKSEEAVQAVFATIRKELANRRPVILRKFGRFIPIFKKARLGRNPRTKEFANIDSRTVVSFRSSKMLKELVNSGS